MNSNEQSTTYITRGSNSVWLVFIICTDNQTYYHKDVKAVCSNEKEVISAIAELMEEFEAAVIGFEEKPLNKLF